MGKKRKRIKKKGYVFVPEGQDEEKLLEKFEELYSIDPQKVKVTILGAEGGNPSSIIKRGCQEKDKTDYVYILLDNDKPLQERNKPLLQAWGIGDENLKGRLPGDVSELYPEGRKPVLLVSLPLAFENTILDLFGLSIEAKTTQELKAAVGSELGKDFVDKIDRKMLENCRNPVIKRLVALFQEMENI